LNDLPREPQDLSLNDSGRFAVGLEKNGAAVLSTQEHHPLDLLSGGDEWAGILAIEEWNQGW